MQCDLRPEELTYHKNTNIGKQHAIKIYGKTHALQEMFIIFLNI